MKFSYGLIPRIANNDARSLAKQYAAHFGSSEDLAKADAAFTQGMRDANLGKGPLWSGTSSTGVESGSQDIATVRRAIDIALGMLQNASVLPVNAGASAVKSGPLAQHQLANGRD